MTNCASSRAKGQADGMLESQTVNVSTGYDADPPVFRTHKRPRGDAWVSVAMVTFTLYPTFEINMGRFSSHATTRPVDAATRRPCSAAMGGNLNRAPVTSSVLNCRRRPCHGP